MSCSHNEYEKDAYGSAPAITSSSSSRLRCYPHCPCYYHTVGILAYGYSQSHDLFYLRAHHPITLEGLITLSAVLTQQGHYYTAEMVLLEAVSKADETFGKEDTNSLEWKKSLAQLYYDHKKYAQAEKWFQKASHYSTRVFGRRHPGTLLVMTDVASVLLSMERDVESNAIFLEPVQELESLHGRTDCNTLEGFQMLAESLAHQGKYLGAEIWARKAFLGRSAMLGEDHKNTLISMNYLAWGLLKQDKFE